MECIGTLKFALIYVKIRVFTVRGVFDEKLAVTHFMAIQIVKLLI